MTDEAHEEETEFSDRAQVAEDFSQVVEESTPAAIFEPAAAAAEEGVTEPIGSPEADESVGEKKPRRRRKRRRKASAEPKSREEEVEREPESVAIEEQVTETVVERETTEDGEAEKTRVKRRRRRSSRKKKSGEDASAEPGRETASQAAGVGDSEHDLDEEDAFEETDEAQSPQRKHRDIPTWEETIGVIVATNTQNRSKKSSRNRGFGKGRSGGRN